MPWYLWLIVGILTLIAIDQLGRWAERKHWIYWRKRKPSVNGAALALGPVLEVFQPSHEIVVEERQRQEFSIAQTESGAPGLDDADDEFLR